MSKLRVLSYSVSLDGFGAGADQGLEFPLGVRGPELMEWFFPTRVFQRMHGFGEDLSTLGDKITDKADKHTDSK